MVRVPQSTMPELNMFMSAATAILRLRQKDPQRDLVSLKSCALTTDTFDVGKYF